MNITTSAIPPHSQIARQLHGADFHHCCATDLAPTPLTALERYLRVAAASSRPR